MAASLPPDGVVELYQRYKENKDSPLDADCPQLVCHIILHIVVVFLYSTTEIIVKIIITLKFG